MLSISNQTHISITKKYDNYVSPKDYIIFQEILLILSA